MGLTAVLVTTMLLWMPLWAQEAAPSSPSSSATATTSSDADAPPNLPVSLDRIRQALADAPVEPLKGLQNQPAHFHVDVQEQQKFEDLVANLKFDSGPPIPGGRYMYEQQQRLFPSVDNPLVQPYAAYTQGELVQVLITSMVERYFAGRVVNSITSAERARAESSARAEVARAIADYCAAQPGAGAGITICTTPDRR
jgi:hypothetical protein